MEDAIKATLHSYKSLATRKQLQITLEVPQEFADTALKMLGIVDPTGTQWFALTRFNAEPLADAAQAAPIHTSDKPRTPFRDMPRSQQAALKLEDEDFRRWVGPHRTMTSESAWKRVCDDMLKAKLEIDSKRELDSDPIKGTKWDALLTDFDNRQHIR